MDDKFISVNRFKETLSRLRVEGGNKEFIQGIAQALSEAVPKLLDDEPAADIQPADGWISCKERMPEDNVPVLYALRIERGKHAVLYGWHYSIKGLGSAWHQSGCGGARADEDVTHWRPLPEPPKED
ncbi:DUF551 domain-containing protein [Ruminococcus flavefaciens]|uniref:DUF551 domain-containing protein n=1 Tax=Ruminococcus flavefaciens TaxID=1265 RepID=UPI0026F21974|nr:DUF551 domain-containing protein [Ruminococcus flavefaciens]